MRIVIDTNLYISALINKNSRNRLELVLIRDEVEIFADVNLMQEFAEVAKREKFRKYISLSQIAEFYELISERVTIIETTSNFKVSPDPKDDFLLSLSYDSKAEYLLTGNKVDLLDLAEFKGTKIITLPNFISL